MRLISKPVLCNYYITYRCNARCGFCDIWERPSPYVTPSEVKKNLIDLKKLGVKVIDFTGGEPLLHRQLPEMLDYAKKLGFITTLTTNCLLYPKYAQKLKEKVDMLHFSLDFSSKKDHDSSRGVQCFDKVLLSIEIAKKLEEKPDILFTVFEKNVAHIQKIYEEIVLPNQLILILNPVFEYNNTPQNSRLSKETLHILSYWGRKKRIYLNQGFIALREDGGNHSKNPVCKAASSTIVISPENKLILPCYHLGLKSIPINGNLHAIYTKNPEVKQQIKQQGKHPQCEGCVINCYMQPSFAVEINKYWWKAFPSTFKYIYLKGTWKNFI